MSKIKLIAGLANPGSQFYLTRHNMGERYIKLLANRYNTSLKNEPKFFGYITKILIFNHNVHLIVPTTFMNLSGKSILIIANFYHIEPEEILIVHDEMDLPPGIAKFKQGGGNGGHNGLKDVIKKIGNEFHRLRIGIGHPSNLSKVNSFILEKPISKEQRIIDCAIIESINCTELWIKENKIKAMNRLHAFKFA